MTMVFTVKTIMIEVIMVMEISLVFPVETIMIVIVVNLVPIVTMPCRIGVIGITRIGLFIDANGDMDLCAD